MATPKPIRDDLYDAMRTAMVSNADFIYRGHDRATGPQAGLGTLLNLERNRWIRLRRATVATPGSAVLRREVVGGWLTNLGRSALRDEVTRRGDTMPARLALRGARPAARPVTPAPAPRRPATTVRPLLGSVRDGAGAAVAALDRPRSLTATADPFALIATGGGSDDDIPF